MEQKQNNGEQFSFQQTQQDQQYQNNNQQKNSEQNEDEEEININNIVNDNDLKTEEQKEDELKLHFNEDLNFVHHDQKISEEDMQERPSMVDIFQEKKVKFQLIKKYLQGVTIVDIHQLENQNGLQEIQDENYLKYEILRCMRSLQRSAKKFFHLDLSEGQDKNKKLTYKEIKLQEFQQQFNSEKMEFLDLDDIQNIGKFTTFRINKMHWPYLVYYEITVEVPISVDKSDPKKEYKIFTDFVDERSPRNCEIFDAFKPHQVNMIVNFWTDKVKNYTKDQYQKRSYEQKQIYNQQQQLVNTLEISQPYFDMFYQKLQNIGAGGFAEVDLYYDTIKDRLMAVKQPVDALDKFQRQQGYDRVPITLIDEEITKIIKAIRELKFEDKQIKELYLQQRNILREIKRLYTLNSKSSDSRSKYINKLEGVMLYDIPYKQNITSQSSIQSYKRSQQQQKTVKLIFQYFGGCEYNNRALTCDLQMYFLRNKNYYMYIEPAQKLKIIQSIYKQVFEAIEFLHDEQVMLRDLKDDNILVRRKFKEMSENESEFEILLIDFAMSKKNKMKIPFVDVEISRRISIPYDQNGIVFRHPRFIYGQDKFEKKDDIFALGIMLLRLFDNIEFPLPDISQQVKDLAVLITGIPYSILYGYYKKSSRQIPEKKCMEYYNKIPKNLKEIKNSNQFKTFFQL